MNTALAPTPDAEAIEQVLVNGDLAKLTPTQRVSYYNRVCQSLGLNPLTKPFDYIPLNGKLTLYAKRDAAEQLRKLHGVSITDIKTERFDEIYVVTVKATDKTGRSDASTGAVPLGRLAGENLANALMKAETKAKRRVTLSICGLGMLDETEVESIQPQGYSVTASTVNVVDMPAHTVTNGLGEQKQPGGAPAGRSIPFGVTQHGEELPADDRLYVSRVDITDTRNKNVRKAIITFSNASQASTINPKLTSLCEQLCQEAAPVVIETKDTKWGKDLVAIARDHPNADGDEDDVPAFDEDPPF